MKKSRFQIKFPASFQVFGKTCLRLTPAQVSAKFPKLENWKNIKNLQTLVKQALNEVSKFSKKFQKKFQVFISTNLLPSYLWSFFSSLEPAPPPYTMEGNNPPSIYGEVISYGFLSNLKIKTEK